MISEHERLEAMRRDIAERNRPAPKSEADRKDEQVKQIPWALPPKRTE